MCKIVVVVLQLEHIKAALRTTDTQHNRLIVSRLYVVGSFFHLI